MSWLNIPLIISKEIVAKSEDGSRIYYILVYLKYKRIHGHSQSTKSLLFQLIFLLPLPLPLLKHGCSVQFFPFLFSLSSLNCHRRGGDSIHPDPIRFSFYHTFWRIWVHPFRPSQSHRHRHLLLQTEIWTRSRSIRIGFLPRHPWSLAARSWATPRWWYPVCSTLRSRQKGFHFRPIATLCSSIHNFVQYIWCESIHSCFCQLHA